MISAPIKTPTFVALRKESVDRNISAVVSYSIKRPSLSARRAWIEIIMRTGTVIGCVVALRKESVDRNDKSKKPKTEKQKSLSARRAWIEIAEVVVDSLDIKSLSARRAWIEIKHS